MHIKWPNDLIIDGRKAGGILLEVAGEQDEVEWVVAGIGINVNTEYTELPVALRRTAMSLKDGLRQPVDRSVLLARILLTLEASTRTPPATGSTPRRATSASATSSCTVA